MNIEILVVLTGTCSVVRTVNTDATSSSLPVSVDALIQVVYGSVVPTRFRMDCLQLHSEIKAQSCNWRTYLKLCRPKL